MDTVAPLKCIHISSKRKFSKPWLTQGIETSNRKVKQLYKETLKSNCSTESLNKYKQHQNLLNKIKRKAKTSFYNTKCEEYRNNTKKLWQVISQTIGKQKHGGSIIPCISIEGIKTYDHKKISNTFRSFYANLGSDLAKKIQSGRTSIDVYVVPQRSWGDRSDTDHSKCLLLGGRRLNLLTIIPKPKGSGGARAATAQIGPANERNKTK